MTLDVRHSIQARICSTDSDLLDLLEAEWPPDILLGAEQSHSRVTNDDGSETLTLRTTFESDGTEADDGGTTVTPSDVASDLYATLTGYDLAGRATEHMVRHYRTPEGGNHVDAIRDWYESNPDKQPTDDDGEAFVPKMWDPQNHVIQEDAN